MANEKSMIQDLTVGPVRTELLRFSVPFMLSNALQTAYNLVDMVVVGQFVGSPGLSAVSIAGQIVWLLTCIAIGYSSGGQIYISQLIGSGNTEDLSKTIGTVFTSVGLFSFLFTAVGLIFHNPLLKLLNTPEEAFAQARDYTLICSIGMFFVYGYNVVSAVLRGMGDAKRPLLFVGMAAVINIFLDLLFVGGFHMAAAGAALATILSQAISFLVSILYLYRRRDDFGFDFRWKSFRVDKTIFSALSSLAIPLTVQTSAINVSMLFVSAGINSYGLVYSSVYGIGSRIHSIIFIITNSISTASATMFGQTLGAQKYNRVKEIYWYGILYCGIFFAVVCILCLRFPVEIFHFFTQDEAVAAEAPHYMVTLMWMSAGAATMTPGIALINGIGNGSLSLITALLDGVVVRIGLCIILSRTSLGVYGYFWGNALAGFVSTGIGTVYYLSGAWKKRKLMIS